MRKKNKTAESWDAAPNQPFVSVLKPTLEEPAWKGLSYGARCLYIALKSFYNGRNNGKIFLGVRKAAAMLGSSSKSSAEKWFRELQEHGFIRATQGAFLGTDGKANATYWRLTELGYMGQQPTREFKEWQPKNKIPYHKSGQTAPIIGAPQSNNRDACPKNRDAFEPNSTSDRPDFQAISIIPSTSGDLGDSVAAIPLSAPPTEALAQRAPQSAVASQRVSPNTDLSLQSPSIIVDKPSRKNFGRAAGIKNGGQGVH